MIVLDPVLLLLIRGALGSLMAFAGIAKLRDVPAFAAAIGGYRILPYGLLVPAAWALASAELVLGVLAIFSTAPLTNFALLGIALLVAFYGAAMAWNLARGRRDVDCGCSGFGKRRSVISWSLVRRNLVLATIGVVGSVSISSQRLLLWIDWLALGCGLMAIALLYAAAEAMRTAFRMEERV